MHSQERKIDQNVADYEEVVESDIKIDNYEEQLQKRHLAISSTILTYSPMAMILVGCDQKASMVHNDLLTLHSGYFRKLSTSLGVFRSDENSELLAITHFQFANFVKWLYSGIVSGELSPDFQNKGSKSVGNSYEGLWVLGDLLQSPNFMNYCMKKIIDYGEKQARHEWPTPEVAGYTYKHARKGSTLRKLVADCLGVYKPLNYYNMGDRGWIEWQVVLEKHPELSLDMHSAAALKPKLWTDDWKASLMIEDIGLEERWEQQILSRRKLQDIRLAAREGCIRSIAEEKHVMEQQVRKHEDQQKKADEYEMVCGLEIPV